METAARRSARVPFIAAAQVQDLATDMRLNVTTGDISQHGVYMDTVNPLPHGTSVKIQIMHGQHTFGATAGVVYSLPHLGMGLVFREIEPAQAPVLEKWLSESESEAN